MRSFFVIHLANMIVCGQAFALPTQTQAPASIPYTELQAFSANSVPVQQTIQLLLNLTTAHLQYQYGSADPKLGAMDCSGTIYYVLNKKGIKEVPRSSDLQYQWVANKGHLYTVSAKATSIHSDEFAELQPGDLLFWSGTYAIVRKTNLITHVMMYLGTNLAGQPLMAGASNGRTYQGRKIYGVSVFDFKIPDSDGHFVGYGCVPGLNCDK